MSKERAEIPSTRNEGEYEKCETEIRRKYLRENSMDRRSDGEDFFSPLRVLLVSFY